MEEILASIRRIIADDQSLPGRPHAEPPVPESPPVETTGGGPEAEVAAAPVDSVAGEERMHILRTPSPEAAMSLESTHATDADASAHRVHPPRFVSPDVPNLDVSGPPLAPDAAESIAEYQEAPPATTAPPGPEPSRAEGVPPHRMEAAAPADNLFSAAVDSSVTTAFNTLAASRLVANSDELMAIAGEMIRPLLKAWVEENLPNVIERLVSAEIERITRGGS